GRKLRRRLLQGGQTETLSPSVGGALAGNLCLGILRGRVGRRQRARRHRDQVSSAGARKRRGSHLRRPPIWCPGGDHHAITESKAWQVARARFPEDRKGQLTHQLAMKVSDSVWHQQLSDARGKGDSSPYWLEPFQNYKTACPYLVGSYTRVAGELAAFITAGHRTFIVDIPSNSEDLE